MAFQSDQDWQLTKKTVLERNSHMFNNPLMSDIAFTCEESEGESMRKCFHAHKYVLATSSPVFHTMFYGDLAEKNSVIHLPDTDEETLEAFLRILYTDQCTTDVAIALKVIYLAKKYMIPSLAERCFELVDANAYEAINSDVFLSIDQETLKDILQRETLVIIGDGELKLFQAVLKWCDHQCSMKGWEAIGAKKRAVLGDAIVHLRFLAMTLEEFANNVSTTGVLTDSEVIDFFQTFSGMAISSLTCDLPRRKGNPHSCFRFSKNDLNDGWLNEGCENNLKFKVDKNVLFHGFRLFGDENGGEYEVAVKGHACFPDFSGTYTSTYINENGGKCYGFDVMLPKPVRITANLTAIIDVTMKGPKSYYGTNGKSSVEVGGVTVNFSSDVFNYYSPNTCAAKGQIYTVFISCCD